MADASLKRAIETDLAGFTGRPLAQPARALLQTLGYRSDKRLDLDPNSAAEFQAQFDPQGRLNAARALLADWRSVDLLQQITADELAPALSGQGQLFHNRAVDGSNIQSYLFFAVDLAGAAYTRSQLAAAAREINKLFPMPALVLFRHGASLTFAILARRVNKLDASRDVLEKVTLIRDIRCANPHRAHLEILADLALPSLAGRHTLATFADLQRAWEKTLDTSELNKKFFREVANWYFWAVQAVVFPDGAGSDSETRNAVSVIRLITRLIFVWFIREKGLVPAELFDQGALRPLLRWNDPKGSTYYKAILQNLFFATLNSEMGEERRFRGKNQSGGRDSHYGIATVYRYEDYFADPAAALRLFASIPFLNGGLFECLDRPAEQVRIDGFSDRADNPLTVPDALFFGGEQDVDLNTIFGTRNKTYKARGLLRIFDSYKFTIEENTPIEEEIALDPELLGKVFENLLASYNPETHTTARKQTGSFYTPREIVDYMVDESLLAYLETALGQGQKFNFSEKLNFSENFSDFAERLRGLLAYSEEPHGFDAAETAALLAAIDRLKCLDPACGSGAFPMGMLHKLVYLLARLDPDNSQWRALQRQKAVRETEEAYMIGDRAERKARLEDIEEAFTNNTSDYGRKLYLIENCIYGVDIQPIAVQIAKLRFFISLVVDQTVDDARPNRGVRPLPNLETKFVAANTLIGIARPQQLALRDPAIGAKERELIGVRQRHFAARSQATKEKYRQADQRLRGELAALLRQDGWGGDTAVQLAAWNPYDQNAHADFFDPEWMFGVTEGFDVVIGNPPYVQLQRIPETSKLLASQGFRTFTRTGDIYCLFYEKALALTKPRGLVVFITSNSWLRTQYGELLRRFLVEYGNPLLLIDFADAQLFASAIVETCTLLVQKTPWQHRLRAVTIQSILGNQESLKEYVANHHVVLHTLDTRSWSIGGTSVAGLMRKMETGSSTLADLGVSINFGIKTGFNQAFIIDQPTRNFLVDRDPKNDSLIVPLLRGRDVRKYSHEFRGVYLINAHNGLRKQGIPRVDVPNEYPIVFEFMKQFEAQLRARKDQGHHWTNLRDCAYLDEFQKPKIIWGELSDKPKFSYDPDAFFAEATLFFMAGDDLKYLLAILNCRASEWYFNQISTSSGMGTNRWKKYKIATLPIQQPNLRERFEISQLADRILAAKAENPAADVSALEAEIDQRVYALYGLTAQEIRIVEGEA